MRTDRSREAPAAGAPRALTSGEFRDVIGHFATGVTVITVLHDDAPLGTTASAVCSLSLEPPMVVICMNETSATGQAVGEAGSFAINILSDAQQDLARRFASKAADKFEGVPMATGPFGQPLLEASLAQLECRVVETVTGGTHVVFLAEVLGATAGVGAPLAYFRGRFGRLDLGATG
jgi:flavin reductase (DIM6/NTAB) family NADH-FMN oxidoreductase RutF